MKVEWDETKNLINIQKHGLSFQEAQEVFNDPHLIEIFDEQHSSTEENRYIGLGAIREILILVVIFQDKEGNVRIISARKANQKEREVYFEYLRRTN